MHEKLLISPRGLRAAQAHQVAAAAAEPARQQPLPNGMALPTSAADTIRAVLDHQQQQRQQQQVRTQAGTFPCSPSLDLLCCHGPANPHRWH